MPAVAQSPVFKRWTINFLPDAKTSDAVVKFASNSIFDKVVRGYRAGDRNAAGDGTKAFSHPHATSVHFEGTEEDFNAIVEFVRQWCKENPEAIRANLKSTKPVLIDIPAGFTKYFTNPTDSNEETCWVDFNLDKDPFMPLNLALIEFIAQRSAKVGYPIEIINGVGEKNHRPHLTGLRADKKAIRELDKENQLPELDLPANHVIEFTISGGPSPKSGEYHDIWITFKQGIATCLDKAKEYLNGAYNRLPAVSHYYNQLPSMRDIVNKAWECAGYPANNAPKQKHRVV